MNFNFIYAECVSLRYELINLPLWNAVDLYFITNFVGTGLFIYIECIVYFFSLSLPFRIVILRADNQIYNELEK